MKTKQNLSVEILGFEIQAQHGAEMVNLNDVLKAGNEYRVKAGLRPYRDVNDILRIPAIAEYVMVVENKLREDQGLPLLSSFKIDKSGRAKLPTKHMVSIEVHRGRYGGTHAHIEIGQRIADYLTETVPLYPIHRSYRIEDVAIEVIEQMLGRKLIKQYAVLDYKIDAYDPVLNIAYEIDEGYHKRAKQYTKDRARQYRIKSLLGCDFVRIDMSRFK